MSLGQRAARTLSARGSCCAEHGAQRLEDLLAFGWRTAEVKRYRAAARVSQEWVARRVGLSRSKVSEVCNGRFLPSFQALDALVTALRSITADAALPVTARAEAARLLAEIRPSSLGEALAVIHGLASTDNPLHRRQVLLAMGSLDTTEAVPPLSAMLHDRTLGPVVRLRCAEALAQLRRDQREPASVVARELSRDEAIPGHVRVRAARHLARWSELCRDEARDLLREADRLSC